MKLKTFIERPVLSIVISVAKYRNPSSCRWRKPSTARWKQRKKNKNKNNN